MLYLFALPLGVIGLYSVLAASLIFSIHLNIFDSWISQNTIDISLKNNLFYLRRSERRVVILINKLISKPRVYKTLFMLNSAEHEIFSANKYENAVNSWHCHIY